VQVLEVAQLEFPWLRTEEDFNSGGVPPAIRAAQEILGEADHLLIIFPLWHGTMPAVLKAFFEQTFRPDCDGEPAGKATQATAEGKIRASCRDNGNAGISLSLAIPGARGQVPESKHPVVVGISPVRTCLIGNIADRNGGYHQRWLEQLHTWGARAQ